MSSVVVNRCHSDENTCEASLVTHSKVITHPAYLSLYVSVYLYLSFSLFVFPCAYVC